MNAEHTSDAPAFGPREVLLILLRNKWTIVLSALLGLGAAAVLYSLMAPSYQSTAKLYVRYIMEQPAGVPGEAVQVRAADSRGDGLMA
ncbi:MAG TPA: hypothetical protein DCY13_00080, partial [Verrucomicrobiales bacterium]|nr:hypothetical protein [Verrucomicrobiales bacterium]